MKISKKAVLLAMSGMFTMASLGLMYVFAENSIDLNVDPNNAIQHFKNVKIISTNINNETYAIINKIGNLIGIETDYNFVLTKSGSNEKNSIKNAITGSSILGGTENSIENGTHNEILGGKENKIEGGKNNSILGGITNKKGNGNHSVIFGGKNNEITGSYSSIVGGEGNKVTKSRAMAIGNNNTTNGYNSVAMGSGSTLSGQNSFLWTDGNSSEGILEQNNIFAIKGKNGVVVNTTKAHNLAQLTVSGSLIVYDNKKVLECTDNTKGVLKVIDGDVYNNNQKCFCSCDGSGRNALHEGTRCEALCNNEAGLQAECGMVEAICGTIPYSYTGAGTSGACIVGELVEGTGAFLINTQSDNTEWIHRSCQTAYGQATGCMQQLTGASCPNLRTGYECIWDHEELTGHLITNPNPPVDSATFWKYDPELKLPCTYMCDQYGEWDPNQGKCIFHECRGELPEGAKLNDEMALPMNDTTDYFYSDTSTGACSYKCNIEFGYYYSGTLNKCVTCPEGQTYDEIDGTCKVACDMSNTSFETITIMDESGYAITIADRNLGATSNNTGEVSSYGCYFQWGNNYGFQPQGNLETSTDFVDTSAYGPGNPYISEIFRVRTGEMRSGGLIVYGPNDDDWSSPANHNLWGGAYDSGNNAFGVLDSDKENRRGPCPEGYHIPSIGERSDLLTIWYNKEYKSVGSGNLPYIKDSGKIISFRGTGDAGLGWAESMKFVKAFRDYFKLPPASSREFDDFAPGITYGEGGSFWTSSSPRLTGSFTSNSLAKNRMIRTNPNNANSFDYNLIGEGYIGHGLAGRKMSAQSVRCFKDVPECPSGKVWNQSELRCESRTGCDVEHTAIQDLELFLISSTGEISHFTMMDRNLGATEIYNQEGKNSQNPGSYGCYFQWGNNYGFSTGAATTTRQVNPASFGPSQYSNDKYYCYTSGYNDPSLYTSINWHIWGGGWRKNNGWSNGSDGTDIDRQGPCPAGYHVPRGKEMDDLLEDWGNANSLRENKGDAFASHILMPYGTYMEVWCGWQNRTRNGGGVWLSDGYNKNGGQYIEIEIQDDGPAFHGISQTHGMQVRCVKNNLRDILSKVSVHPDGGTGAVIAIDWETEGTGKITALGTPTKNGIDFLGWYSNPSFAAEFKVNTGDYISSGGHLYARWDGCNIVDTAVQDLEVFFLLSPSRISHYVMMDRNLGATEAFNQDISSPNESSYGCYFQWGNNYPFNGGRNGSSSTTGTLTDTENYGPGRSKGYYYNSTRYCVGGGGEGMYPYADRAGGIPLATWFWGGGWIKTDGDTYTDSGGINGTDIDRQGPCPTGYHIPRGKEMENIMDNRKVISNYNQSDSQNIKLEKSKIMASDLLLPFAGWNGEGCGNENHYLGKGMFGKYLISDYYKFEKNHLHIGETSDPDGIFLKGNGPSFGYSLRCVKNNISDTPQKVTINAYGGTGAVIAIDWETAENGRIVTLGEPKKDGYDFGGWYSDPLFSSRIYTGDNISKEGNLYAKWIAKDCDIANTAIQDLELFFLSETGNISHYMMMDRNLGATEIYNKNSSSQNKKSFGCFFQWGNNYGFPMEIGNTRSTPIDVSSYGPDNYYINSTLFCNGAEGRMYTGLFTDLWGGITNTDISKKGPCPEGYHIPNLYETNMLINGWKSASAGSGIQFASDILLPFAGAISPNCGSGYKNVGGNFWSSDMSANGRTPHHIFILKSGEIGTTSNGVATGFPLRCVKNNLTTSPQKVTIHPDGGTGAVIAIDWESEGSGKIMTLGTPSKLGYSFSGRYSDEGFTNKVNTGDYISSGVNLYAKWDELIAVFMEGSEFNNILSSLAGIKGNINRVKRIDSILSGVTTGLISDVNSPAPIIARYDSGSIYYYSEANKVYLNENSQGMFESFTNLEQIDVSRWNTTNVKTMSGMFRGCSGLLSLDVSNWDTSNVTNMSSMFENCYSLTNLDVSRWNTSNVSDMSRMFVDCSSLEELDVSNWDTSNVTTMYGLFAGDDNGMNLKYLDVSNWDTSKVTTMRSMFRNCINLTGLDVSNWNTSKVTDMAGMFQNCDNLINLDVSRWNVGKVTDINHMFYDCYNLTNLDVSNWNTSNVTNMRNLFYECESLTGLDVSNWDTSNVTDMGFMFGGTDDRVMKLTELDLSNWNTSNVTNMKCMFQSCSNLKTIYASTGFVVDQVTNSDKMFYRDTKLVGGFGTKFIDTYRDKTYAKVDSEVQSGYFTQLKATYLLPGTQFNQTIKRLARQNSATYNTSNTTITQIKQWTGNDIPSGVTTGLLSQNDSVYPTYAWFKNGIIYYYTKADRIYLNEDSSYMFNMLTGLINVEINEWNTSKVTNMKSMFYGCSNLTKLDVSNWNTFKVTNMSSMFENCYNLINLDVSKWNTSNVSDMSRMFVDCSSLEELDVSNWNTSNVTNMFAVFGGNNNYMNLKHLDVSNWDTSKVTTMRSMFRNCINLTGLDVSNWNTSNVENMYMLFGAEYDYMNLEYIDVSKWDTSKVTNMRGTFRNCIKLTGLDVSKWNTSNVIDMRFMFASMAKNGGALPMNLENLDVSNWDTSSVTDMGDMFQNCVNLSGLDVSNWNTSNVTDMEAMFYKCSNLTELDLTNRKTNKVTNMSFMFNSNTNLKTIYASTGFVTTKVTSDTGGDYLFYGDTKLVGGNRTEYSSSHTDKEYARIDQPGTPGYFTLKQ